MGTNNILLKNGEQWWVDTKNRTCFYFDDVIRVENIYFENILSDKKSYENI